MTLEEMELSKVLEREPLRRIEIKQSRDAIAGCLADASNEDVYDPNRLGLAYKAILKCALLALRCMGFRLKSASGHHRHAMESLEHTLGVSPEDVDYMCDLAQARHDDLYESALVSDTDLAEAIKAATELAQRLDAWLRNRDLLAP